MELSKWNGQIKPRTDGHEASKLKADDGSFLPQHMSVPDRNERLYNRLLEMGLVVLPQFNGDDKTMISHFIVSTGPVQSIEQDQG